MTEQIEEQISIIRAITVLAKVNKRHQERVKATAAAKKKLEESELYKEYEKAQNAAKSTSNLVDSLKALIREQALREFEETGDKTPVKGVQIKSFSIVSVTDDKTAKKWAAENAPLLLSLDLNKFRKAVENLDLPFVVKGVEHRAEIASDLSMYLPEQKQEVSDASS